MGVAATERGNRSAYFRKLPRFACGSFTAIGVLDWTVHHDFVSGMLFTGIGIGFLVVAIVFGVQDERRNR